MGQTFFRIFERQVGRKFLCPQTLEAKKVEFQTARQIAEAIFGGVERERQKVDELSLPPG